MSPEEDKAKQEESKKVEKTEEKAAPEPKKEDRKQEETQKTTKEEGKKPEEVTDKKPEAGTTPPDAPKPAETQKPKEKPVTEKPSACSKCGKRLSRKKWYYRDNKYFCNKSKRVISLIS